MAAAGTPAAAYELLRAAIRTNDPVMVHEHKVLYLDQAPVARGRLAEVGKASVEREGGDVTIVATMLMVHRALQAADQLADEGVEAEVIDLRWLRPLDLDTVPPRSRTPGACSSPRSSCTPPAGAPRSSPPGHARGAEHRPRVVGLPDDLLIPYAPRWRTR